MAVLMVAVSGCLGTDRRVDTPHTDSTSPKVQTVSHDCPSFATDRWIDVPSHDDEPRLRIPQPAGWERFNGMDPSEGRLVLRNETLSDGISMPVVVVNIVQAASKSRSPEQVVSAEVDSVRADGPIDLATTATTVCGYPAAKLTYNKSKPAAEQGQPAVVGPRVIALVSAVNAGGRVWTAVVALQAPNPDDPAFAADLNTLLTGFQILSPEARSGKNSRENGR
jgi:hypothetical protein